MTSHYFRNPKYQVESSIFIYYIASGLWPGTYFECVYNDLLLKTSIQSKSQKSILWKNIFWYERNFWNIFVRKEGFKCHHILKSRKNHVRIKQHTYQPYKLNFLDLLHFCVTISKIFPILVGLSENQTPTPVPKGGEICLQFNACY